MRARWEKWGEEKIALELAGSPDELRDLARRLLALSGMPAQHFHLSESGKGHSPVADIEISVLTGEADRSLEISSFAVAPGEEIPDPPGMIASPPWPWPRIISIGAALAGVLLTVVAFLAGTAAVAEGGERAVFSRGALIALAAMLAFHLSSVYSREWKARLALAFGALAAADILLELVRRLGGQFARPWPW